MSSVRDPRLANLFAVLCTTVADEIRDRAESTTNLGGAAAATLVALREGDAGESMDRLRRTVGLTPSGAVRLVDRLVEQGLVRRRAGKDGRSVSLSLTARGSRVAGKILRGRAAAAETALSTLTAAEQATLTRLSEKLVGGLTAARLARRREGELPAGGAMCRLCDFTACGRDQGRCPAERAAADG